MAISYTESRTYTVADIQATFRRFRSDIFMIADSSGAITRSEADDYAHDAEYLATRGYLRKVDVTLLFAGIELRAAAYTVNENAGDLESSRPGGVLWPRINGALLRVIFSYTPEYTAEAKIASQSNLRITWSPTTDDINHTNLNTTGVRSYVSHSYGLDRKDFG